MKIVRHHQQGVVLFVALIVLIIMTLAGLALLRQMGAGTSIAGNIAFKENATSVADHRLSLFSCCRVGEVRVERRLRCDVEANRRSLCGPVP